MKLLTKALILSLGIGLTLGTGKAIALPGQTTEEVMSWMNANSTLRPSTGDGLVVRKTNTPAQRFVFEASVFPVGKISFIKDRNIIRKERFYFYDQINGITSNRLQETLRILYGLTIYQDFQTAKVIYSYPSPVTIDLARRKNKPLLALRQGELRLGERFAYWMEITNTDKGKAYNGEMTILLKEDLEKLEIELSDR